MPVVHFTSQLERFLPAPSVDAGSDAATLGDALDAVFKGHPRLRSYILDDQGALRRHIAVFIAGRPAKDRVKLTDSVGVDDEIHVFQALSGG